MPHRENTLYDFSLSLLVMWRMSFDEFTIMDSFTRDTGHPLIWVIEGNDLDPRAQKIMLYVFEDTVQVSCSLDTIGLEIRRLTMDPKQLGCFFEIIMQNYQMLRGKFR